MSSLDRVVEDRARRRHGLITWADARSIGFSGAAISRRSRPAGPWVRVERGVYRLRAFPQTWEAGLLAACLATGGVVCRRSACVLYGFPDFRPGRKDILVPASRRMDRPELRIHRTTQFDLIERREIQAIPVTGPERTLLDIGTVTSYRQHSRAVDDAIRRKLITWQSLLALFTRQARRGRNGSAQTRLLLDARYGDDHIPLSDWAHVVADMLSAAGLARPVPEWRIFDHGGGFVAQVDLAYPELRVAIELQSERWHLNRESFHRDPVRINRIQNLGWQVLLITWAAFIDDPQQVIDQVRSAVAQANTR